MTSASVSNMTIPVATSGPSKIADAKAVSSDAFMQVMSNAKRETTEAVEPKAKQNIATIPMNDKPNVVKQSVDNGEKEVAQEVKDQVSTYADEVKKVIAEDLEVTEDEVVDAMETLGLTFLDLNDVTNLMQLVTELTGTENNVSLLVSDSFTALRSDIADLTQNLFQETDVVARDVENILSNLQSQPMEEGDVEEMPVVQNQLVDDVQNVQTEQVVTSSEAEVLVVSEVLPKQVEDVEITEKSAVETREADAKEQEVEMADVSQVITSTDKEEETSGQSQNFSQQQTREDMTSKIRSEHVVVQDVQAQPVNQYQQVAAEVTLPTGETVSAREIIDQLVEAARTTISAEETTLEMILHPEGLGKVFMEISEKNGNVTAKFVTQNENVKEALENQMVVLKEQLNQTSNKVTSIEVTVGTHEFERNLEEGQFERQQDETEQQAGQKRTRNIDMNNLDELSGLMTEEEELVAKIMREGGNSINFTA